MSRNTETSYSGQWEHTRQAFSPHHYQLNTMWSILLCCPPWPNGAYSPHCSLSVNRMDALGTTGLVAWRQPLQSQSCQTKILFHGLLTIHTTTTFQSCDTIISVATFPHVAHSVAMIYHAMNAVKAVVTHLHPEQADQPMYSLAKRLQWNFPATHGEDRCVVFLGGIHVELTVEKCLGNWIEGSGWTTAVTNSGIASGGTADSFLKTSHLGRTRHVYQLTAAVLYILVDHAYVPYHRENSPVTQTTPEPTLLSWGGWPCENNSPPLATLQACSYHANRATQTLLF